MIASAASWFAAILSAVSPAASLLSIASSTAAAAIARPAVPAVAMSARVTSDMAAANSSGPTNPSNMTRAPLPFLTIAKAPSPSATMLLPTSIDSIVTFVMFICFPFLTFLQIFLARAPPVWGWLWRWPNGAPRCARR